MVKKKKHEEKQEEKTFTINKGHIVAFLAFLIVGIVFGLFLSSFLTPSQSHGITTIPKDVLADTTKKISKEEAAKKAVDFLNKNIFQPKGAVAKIDKTEEKYGLYASSLSILQNNELVQKAEVFITLDGKSMFLTNPIDLEKPLFKEGKEDEIEKKEMKKTKKPKVMFFLMTYCPFGQQAIDAFGPVAKLLKDKIDFEPHYIIYDKRYGYAGKDYCFDENNEYCSMHGISELNEGIRQLIIWKYFKDKFWDYVSYVNKNISLNEIDQKWVEAANANNIDVEKVKEYFNKEALVLLENEKKLNKQYNATGSPTIFVNDVPYSGEREPESFKNTVCSAFLEKPVECEQKLSSSQSSPQPLKGQC